MKRAGQISAGFARIITLVTLFAGSSPAQDSAARRSDPSSLLGGSTLESGNAVWLRPSAGYDFDVALLGAELGYTRALQPDLDVGVALGSNLGFTSWLTGTLRGRWSAVRHRFFRLAVDVPLSLTRYTSGEGPHPTMIGTEPGVTMSTPFTSAFGLFYGAALRYYHLPSTDFFGPEVRLGLGWALGDFRLSFGASLSEVIVTATPSMTLFSAELGVAYLFEGP